MIYTLSYIIFWNYFAIHMERNFPVLGDEDLFDDRRNAFQENGKSWVLST